MLTLVEADLQMSFWDFVWLYFPGITVLYAECLCATTELDTINCPPWALREVTYEPQWSGALLASGD